jgi:para-aminobenzoate synthetase component 1
MNLKETLNYHGSMREPFFFCISYDLTKWDVTTLNTLDKSIQYCIGKNNIKYNLKQPQIFAHNFKTYKKQFFKIIEEIKNGNTYLLNLTAKSKIKSNYSLEEIFTQTNAKYKLLYKNKFVSFSPESFVIIKNNTIASYPMKGTIDANIHDAKNKILNNPKEFAEHTMIVDLLRNDLNLISSNVRVEHFRYLEQISAGDKSLYQASSKIVGDLDSSWHDKIGDILLPLLPAGSITGTPKKSTIGIINKIEDYDRGWFTGIWGIYDGSSLDSSVLIRFVEQENNDLFYKSGGGITLDSNLIDEYNELNDKIYFP